MQHLGQIIGENLRRLRSESGSSLDALARLSGVSKSRLGQIERGEANPSVTTLWQIANALKVEFSALITAPRANSVVASKSDVEPVMSEDGAYRTYSLFGFDPVLGSELFLSEVDPGGRLHADPHPDGTWETIVVSAGTLTVETAGETHLLGAGDAIRFKADRAHEYANPGTETAVLAISIAYPRQA